MIDGPDDLAYSQAYNDQPGDQTAAYFAQDEAEAAKLNQFYQGSVNSSDTGSGMQWWEQLAKYGATRAIDAHFQPATVDKTMTPGTYAGQNGKTYTRGSGTGAAGGDTMLLLLLGGAALFALS